MAEKTITRYQGVVLPSERFSADTRAAKGAGGTDSSYTQAGAKTGVPAPSNDDGLVLQATGSQSEDGSLELYCQQGGLGGDGRSGYVWRDLAAGDSATEYYGQDSPNVISGAQFPWYTTSASLYYDPVPRPMVGADGLLHVVLTHIKSSGALKIGTYTASTGAWTDANFTPDRVKDSAGTVYEQHGPALVELSAEGVAERQVLIIGSPSDDNVDVYVREGSSGTFGACAYNALKTRLPNADIREMAAAVDEVSGEIALLIAYRDGSSNRDLAQYVSHDHGASFDLVQSSYRTVLSQDPERPDVTALQGGGFIFGFVDNDGSAAQAYVGRLLNASDDGSAVTLVSPAGSGATSSTFTSRGFALVRGEGGRVLSLQDNTGTVNRLGIYFSEDSGATFTAMHPVFATTVSGYSTGGYPHTFGAAFVDGTLILVSRWSSTSDTHDDSSVLGLALGGHSRHTLPGGTSPGGAELETYTFEGYIGWDKAVEMDGGAYFAIGTPSSMGWTETASGGSGAIAVPGCWEVTTTAGQSVYWSRSWADASGTDGPLGNGPEAAVYEFGIDIDSGDGDNTTNQISAKLRFSDSNATTANFVYELEVRFDSGGYRLWDPVAGASVNALERAQDFTTHTRVRVAIDKSGNVKTWVCVPAHDREWVEAIGGTLTDDSGSNPTNTNLVEWGHRATGANVSRFHFVGYSNAALRWGPITDDEIGATWTNPDDLRHRLFVGEFDRIVDDVSVRALTGAACRGDTWQIDAEYDYPIGNLLVVDEPSRDRPWRSTGETEALIVFDLESETFSNNANTSFTMSPVIAAFAHGANFPTFYLEGYNGSTWDTLGTADATAGFTGMVYSRNGSVVRPGSGTFTVENFLFRGAHIEDSIDLGSSVIRKISGNSEGVWTNATAKIPAIHLDGPDGSEAASGTASLWCRDFGVVVHDHNSTYEKYRIRIPATTTADGYFQAKFTVGPVVAFGHQHDDGWTIRRERAYRDQVLPYGRRRRRSQGSVRRVVEIAWANTAVDAKRAWLDQTSERADYIVPGASLPGATPHDTLHQVEALIEELAGGPALLLRRVPSGSATAQINLREQLVLGRFVTDPQRDNVLGDEVVDPIDRLNTLRFEEEL